MAERENRRERRDDRRDNRPEETPEFADRLVAINRVSKTVKGGKRFGFAALVNVLVLRVGLLALSVAGAAAQSPVREPVLEFYAEAGAPEGALFVANAAFNNLGFAFYSTALNWGRATLGVAPFIALGGQWYGALGVLAGYGLGVVGFGVAGMWLCRRVIHRLEARAG